MKSMILATALVALPGAWALAQNFEPTPLEPEATISDNLPKQQLDALAGMVRLYGHPCDSISSAETMTTGHGFQLSCNEAAHSYEIEYAGGQWTVTPL